MADKIYSYVIKSKTGKVIKGVKEAASDEALKEYFNKQGYLVFSIEEIDSELKGKQEKIFFGVELREFRAIFPFVILGLIFIGLKVIQHSRPAIISEEEKLSSDTAVEGEISHRLKDEPEQILEEYFVPESEFLGPQETSGPMADIRGDIKISLEGPTQPAVTQDSLSASGASDSYKRAKSYYGAAVGSGSKTAYRKAIAEAQKALFQGYKVEEMKEIIRNSRKSLTQ